MSARNTDGEAQTGEGMAVECKRVLESYGLLHDDRLVAVVSDQCSANVSMWREMRATSNRTFPILGLGCVPHTLNLLIHDIIKCGALSAVVKQCTAIVDFFRNHHAARAALETAKALNPAGHQERAASLDRPCDTRWNSQIDCMESVKSLLDCLRIAVQNKDVQALLEKNEFKVVKASLHDDALAASLAFAIALTKPVAVALDGMQKGTTSLGDVYPVYDGLIAHYEKLESSHLPPPAFYADYSALKKTIVERMKKLNVEGCLRLACALHPGNRSKILAQAGAGEEILKEARTFFNRYYSDKDVRDKAVVQLMLYLSRGGCFADDLAWDVDLGPGNDPGMWWISFSGSAPELATLARRLLAISPSSASIERVFSRLGRYEDSRPRLLTDTLVQSLIISEYLESQSVDKA